MPGDRRVDGWVAPGFERVREAFAAFPRGGSALAVIRDGQPVVDLREGWQDAARTRPWTEHTLVNVYSVSKPVIALALLILVDRGLLGLDDPVDRHWPGFRAPVSVRQVLDHTAGLPIFPVARPATAWADWELLCGDLAEAQPLWEPGTVAAEHALTYGHLVGEIVRLVDGRPPGRFVAEEIAGPLGLDFGFGCAPEARSRCAELEFDSPDWPARNLGEPDSIRTLAVVNPHGARDLDVVNGDLWRSATIPAVNLHTTAMAVARFYAAPVTAGLAVRQFAGVDRFVGTSVVWGLGVQIEPDDSWGMGGLGGNAGWYDPKRGQAIAYVTRRLGDFTTVDRIEAALQNT
jgi:CubicO group peptidase (beta-lactamase class C family)